jgi:LuxR family transcriptional regulator, maltose regulon positive regulatory protein
MALKDRVIQSQLIPPRRRKGVLRRPRLEARLAEALDLPLTLLLAGTGYGKSTALATLAEAGTPLSWYTVTEPDRDPLLFLAHLICAFGHQEPAWCEPVWAFLQEAGGRVSPEALTPLLNALARGLEEEAVLVLDDYHLVADVPEIGALVERLIDYAPPRLHVVLASRHQPPLPAWNRWRVKGQVRTLTRADLAFTTEEIEALFRDEYGHPLTRAQAEALAAETEGWAIALQMVWQSLQSGAVQDVDAVLGRLPATLEALFDYLAHDVLARQPPAVQRFLLTTAVLRQMEGTVCDYLLATEGSAATLRRLEEDGLFIVSMGEDHYRYQRLFHDFLRTRLAQAGLVQAADAQPGQAQPERPQVLHRRAAAYHHQAGNAEETVYHLLQAQDYQAAAELIEELGPGLVTQGRLDSLMAWIGSLPEEVRTGQPGLDLLAGDVWRLRARFDEALACYAAAESRYVAARQRLGHSRALRGQALVYLDTVRPLMADSLLEDALRLLEPEEHRADTAALLDHLAENKLNLGLPEEAQALHHEARLLRAQTDPGDLYLEARAMVRTGRLAEAQWLLEGRAQEEQQMDRTRPQRFHRETLLLLSLAHVLQGHAAEAEQAAHEGIAVGQRLCSAFVEAVGAMRLGHALQLQAYRPWEALEWSSSQAAIACYQRAIEQVRGFRVMRTQVEPLWGLCRAYGTHGDLDRAEQMARQALEITDRAGDGWMGALMHVTLGAAYVRVGTSPTAQEWLGRAERGFGQVGDPFGRSAARLWLALDAWRRGELEAMAVLLAELLPTAEQMGYDCLLVRRTFLGLDDDQAAAPLLIEARARGICATYAGRLLAGMGLAGADYHPGYSLAVRTLGPFAAWRGREPVTAQEWRREKARQVFQVLLTHRSQRFHREQIVEQLWPHLPPEAGERDFKVALTALNQALEPARPRGLSPFFVTRLGSGYGLNPAARIAVDASDFARWATSDSVDDLRRALALYQEDYLPDCLYEDWSAAERQRLRDLYLVAAERLAHRLAEAGAWDEVVPVGQEILARDDCWEAAYGLLMQAYAAQGFHSQVHTVYQRCVEALRRELDVEPSPEMQALYARLSR